MKIMIAILTLFITANVFSCENIRYADVDVIVVSPNSVDARVLTFLPHRGVFDFVRISRDGDNISIFELMEARVMYRGSSYERELWFEHSRVENALLAEMPRRGPYDQATQLFVQLHNRDFFPHFYTVAAGKCVDDQLLQQ